MQQSKIKFTELITGLSIKSNNDNNNNNKGHIYTGKLVQQNEFAAINQGPVNLIPRI